jgi:hypothetical protein
MYTTCVPSFSKTDLSTDLSTTVLTDLSDLVPSPTLLVQQPPAQQYLEVKNRNQTFLQIAETIVGRADTFRFILQEHTRKLLNSRKLCALLQWTTLVANRSEDNLDTRAKQSEALSLAIDRASRLVRGRARGHCRALALEQANILDTAARYAHAIASRIDANIAQGEKSSAGRAFIDSAVATWYSGEFDPYMLDLTQEETRNLKNFLCINYLIVQCHALSGLP